MRIAKKTFNSLYGILRVELDALVSLRPNFQFPLWDTDWQRFLQYVQQSFQFPLWDTDSPLGPVKKCVYNFQFPLWDTKMFF